MECFPDIFEKNQNKKVNNGTQQEREQAKIVDVRKKKFKIVWEKFQHRAGSICSKLDSTLGTYISLVQLKAAISPI